MARTTSRSKRDCTTPHTQELPCLRIQILKKKSSPGKQGGEKVAEARAFLLAKEFITLMKMTIVEIIRQIERNS